MATIIVLAGVYVGAGFLTTFQKSKLKKEEFKVDWTDILKWPVDIFGGSKEEK